MQSQLTPGNTGTYNQIKGFYQFTNQTMTRAYNYARKDLIKKTPHEKFMKKTSFTTLQAVKLSMYILNKYNREVLAFMIDVTMLNSGVMYSHYFRCHTIFLPLGENSMGNSIEQLATFLFTRKLLNLTFKM